MPLARYGKRSEFGVKSNSSVPYTGLSTNVLCTEAIPSIYWRALCRHQNDPRPVPLEEWIGEDGGGVRLMYALEGQGVSLREEITVSSQSGTKLVGVFGKSARPVRAEDLCRQARPNPQGNQLERGRGRL